MIRSMTAFAAGERNTEAGVLGCELRAVNHRFLEVGVRLPEELRVLEPALRERIAARISRGKLDLTLRLRPSDAAENLRLNEALVSQLSSIAQDLDDRFPNLRTELGQLLQLPGVLQSSTADPETLQAQALSLLDTVLDQFVVSREREGKQLAGVIAERVDAIAAQAAIVRTLIPLIRIGQRQKLDVDEELDRLDSHIVEIRRVLAQKEPVGRRLDFLLQEFNREANTLGSKSVDTRTSQAAVELKVLIDQIREQVQNIE